MTSQDDQWDAMIRGLRGGDAGVLSEFFRRYGPALERVAAKAIEPGMRRRFGPESIAQSVCRTFMRRAKDGAFELTDGDRLWQLLCAIALTKVREKARFHLRHKRGVDREVSLDAGDSGQLSPDQGPSPEEAAIFADSFEHLLASLTDEERRVVELRLEDHTQDEIARELACSERTVRRMLKRIEARLIEDGDLS